MPLRLTGHQLAIMKLLWKHGDMTVAEVLERLPGRDRPAYSTVATVLGRLEKRGLIKHRREGRTYHFSPAVTENGVVREVVDRVFGGSAAALVSHLLQNEALPVDELEAIKQLVNDHERNASHAGSKQNHRETGETA